SMSSTTMLSTLPPLLLSYSIFFPMLPQPPTSTLFPYTTLFRSIPAPRAAPTTAPMDVATIWLGIRFACSSALKAPACASAFRARSEEHTSELQSRGHLVCRLLLEKKKRGWIRAQPRRHYQSLGL